MLCNLYVGIVCTSILCVSKVEAIIWQHRRTGNVLPGGAVNFCPNFYETVLKEQGQTMQQRSPYWHVKVARYCNKFFRVNTSQF